MMENKIPQTTLYQRTGRRKPGRPLKRFPAGAGNFSLHRVQNGSGAHPASYPMGIKGSFLGNKVAEA
jgi:hypothetical protein